jgi:hypothetical protein
MFIFILAFRFAPIRCSLAGQKPPNSTDFTKNPTAAARLSKQLVNFFGGALGCSDKSIPPYVGMWLSSVNSLAFSFGFWFLVFGLV